MQPPVALVYSKGPALASSDNYPCRLHFVADPAQALAQARARRPDIVIAEAIPGDSSAVDLLRRLYLETDAVRILAAPFPLSHGLAMQALNVCHAFQVLRIPWLPLELISSLQMALVTQKLPRLPVPSASATDPMGTRGNLACYGVEDDPDYRLLIADGWGMASHFPIRLSPDVAHLLAALRVHQAGDAGLVLIDLNLPGVNGFEAMREIYSDPELSFSPVVIYTASNDTAEIRRAYDLGARGYLVKPRSFSDLVGQMGSLSRFWLDHNCHPRPGAPPELVRAA